MIRDVQDRSITVRLRLRPLRLAFLIPLNDRALLRRALQINTCVWGGRYNPIIPIFSRTPSWWSDLVKPSARAIVRGYLDAFEPDYVVPMASNLAGGLNIPEDRVISPTDVLNPASDDSVLHGVSVIELFGHMY